MCEWRKALQSTNYSLPYFSSPVAAQGLCAYAFKLSNDPHRGMLAFLRVYAGTLRPHTSLYNVNRNTQSVQPQLLILTSFHSVTLPTACRERVSRVLLARAGDLQEVGGVGEGNIAVAMGLKQVSSSPRLRLLTLQLPPAPSPQTRTGDTLVQSAAIARTVQKEVGVAPLLTPPNIPPPVFFCTVEPASAIVQKGEHTHRAPTVQESSLHSLPDLDHALSCISREDPSLRVSVDRDTGQVSSLP